MQTFYTCCCTFYTRIPRRWKGHVGYRVCLQIKAILFDRELSLAVSYVCFCLFLWFFFCHFSIYTRILRRWKVEPCRLPYLSSNWPHCSRSLKCLFLSSSLLTVVVALFTPKFQAWRQWKGHVGYHACLQIEAIIFDWKLASFQSCGLINLFLSCSCWSSCTSAIPQFTISDGKYFTFLLEYFLFF